MPDIILPDSRWEQPELLYPNRKPVGNVKIDWEHPLTKGLIGYWLCNEPNGKARNLCTLEESVLFGSGEYYQVGSGIGTPTGSAILTGTAQPDLPLTVDYVWSITCTIVSAPNTAYVLIGNRYDSPSGSSNWMKIHLNGVSCKPVSGTSSSLSFTTPTLGEKTTILAAKNGATLSVYVDGVLVDSDTSLDSALPENPVYISGGSEAGHETTDLIVHTAFHGYCSVDGAKAKSLFLNPYQLLIPA